VSVPPQGQIIIGLFSAGVLSCLCHKANSIHYRNVKMRLISLFQEVVISPIIDYYDVW